VLRTNIAHHNLPFPPVFPEQYTGRNLTHGTKQAVSTIPLSTDPGNIPGVLNGSRFIEQPHIRVEVDAFRNFIAGPQPVLLEIGFDHGRRLHSMATLNPQWRITGVEVRKRRVQEAVDRAQRDGLSNIHPWRMDARTVLASVLETASVDVIEVLFPTPWWHPALRRKRRLLNPRFLADAHRVLRPKGLLHLATDVDEYAKVIDDVLGQSPFVRIPKTQAEERLPRCEQLSRREWKCQREGTPIRRWYLECSRQAVTNGGANHEERP